MRKNKAFTILELLVVVAIIAILAAIAIPNFIGKIDQAKASRELAEINAVTKAVSNYYVDHGVYPTLQGKDGTLLQPQPIFGSPHNVDFSSLVPDYLATLPHFSYWWVDYEGNIYHTQEVLGSVLSGVFTPTAGYAYEVHKTNGTVLTVSSTYTLLAGEYITGFDALGVALPEIGSAFKNAKIHPESGEVEVVTFTAATFTNAGALGRFGPTQAQLDTAYSATQLAGRVVSSGGIQLWTVPKTGTYRIEVYGAEGGLGTTRNASGKGAIIKGTFVLNANAKLFILVGQKGGTSVYTGGGGGATFVSKGTIISTSTPLIVAGGGGAGNYYNNGSNGSSALTSGQGIAGASASNASGGAGFGMDSENALQVVSGNIPRNTGAKSFVNGGVGGEYGYNNYGAEGGFGGGGGSGMSSGEGGGGGGYQGGSTSSSATYGGLSYNIGTAQDNSTGNTGDGKVIITYVGP